MLSRNFSQKCVRVNYINFYIVISTLCYGNNSFVYLSSVKSTHFELIYLYTYSQCGKMRNSLVKRWFDGIFAKKRGSKIPKFPQCGTYTCQCHAVFTKWENISCFIRFCRKNSVKLTFYWNKEFHSSQLIWRKKLCQWISRFSTLWWSTSLQ